MFRVTGILINRSKVQRSGAWKRAIPSIKYWKEPRERAGCPFRTSWRICRKNLPCGWIPVRSVIGSGRRAPWKFCSATKPIRRRITRPTGKHQPVPRTHAPVTLIFLTETTSETWCFYCREVTKTFNPEAQCFRPIDSVSCSLNNLSLSPSKSLTPFGGVANGNQSGNQMQGQGMPQNGTQVIKTRFILVPIVFVKSLLR